MRNSTHVARDRSIILRQIVVRGAHVFDPEIVAGLFEVEVHLFHARFSGVFEIDEHDSSDRARDLIHQSARFSEVDGFRKLPDLRDLDVGQFPVAVEGVEDPSDQNLERGGRGEPASGRHVRTDVRLKAADLITEIPYTLRDSQYKRFGSSVQGRIGIARIRHVKFERVMADGTDGNDSVSAFFRSRCHGQIHGGGENASSLMIRMVAAEFGPSVGGHGDSFGFSHMGCSYRSEWSLKDDRLVRAQTENVARGGVFIV